MKIFSERSNEFWPHKSTPNFENYQFLMALTQKVFQDLNKSFEHGHLDIKIFSISPHSLKNSTSVTTLVHNHFFANFSDFFKEGDE